METLGAALVALAGLMVLAFGMSWSSGARKERAVGHPLRRRLVELILRSPGVRLATLWQELDANRKTANYHLMILERAELIASIRGPRVTRYFPTDVREEERPLVSLLLRGRVLEMASQIVMNPGISQQELGKNLTMSRKVLREYANLLVGSRLLEEIRMPRSRRYYATPRLTELLEHVSKGGADKAEEGPTPPGGVERPW